MPTCAGTRATGLRTPNSPGGRVRPFRSCRGVRRIGRRGGWSCARMSDPVDTISAAYEASGMGPVSLCGTFRSFGPARQGIGQGGGLRLMVQQQLGRSRHPGHRAVVVFPSGSVVVFFIRGRGPFCDVFRGFGERLRCIVVQTSRQRGHYGGDQYLDSEAREARMSARLFQRGIFVKQR